MVGSDAKDNINIVIIMAPGYSGATWVNLVLGCHPSAMAFGPPERILTLPRRKSATACYIHGKTCSLWPAFFKKYGNKGDFFRNLSIHADKNTFILNYPSDTVFRRHIQNKGYRVRFIKLVRDGRANLFSYMRHKGLSGESGLIQAIREWLLPKWREVDLAMPVNESEWALLRYEDMVAEPQRELLKLADVTGISDYSDDSHMFWKFEHHLAAGNTGVIDTLCQLQGYQGHPHHLRENYETVVEKLRHEPENAVIDHAWKGFFSDKERLIFDDLAGVENAALGYERDFFTDEERSRILQGTAVREQL